MPLSRAVSASHTALSPRRPLLLALSVLVVGLCAARFLTTPMEQDIEAMLPDTGSAAAEYRLLAAAPFTRSVVIGVYAGDGADTADLISAVDRLAADLDSALFPRVTTGPDPSTTARLLPWTVRNLPALLDPDDLGEIGADLGTDTVAERLAQQVALLHSPEGMVLKGLVRADPLSLRQYALRNLRHLALVPGARLQGGHFVSTNGRSALVIAHTPVPITDAGGAERVAAGFRQAAEHALPTGVRAELVSGHRYTLANRDTIQRDLRVVFGVSLAALAAIFAGFLRSVRSLAVFGVPLAAVAVGGGVVSLLFARVSAITVGFGAVLLGITVDYALHVYFALRRGDGAPAEILGRLTRPVLFGGMTTAAAFAVLLLSDLPGQRQMAVFSIAGIVTALVLSLLVLPHWIAAAPWALPPSQAPDTGRCYPAAPWIWLLAIALLATQMGRIEFNGNLRDIGVIPPELARAEAELGRTWGNFRGKALVFVEGSTPEEALTRNDRVYRFLAHRFPDAGLVSLAPLLPSRDTQVRNGAAWTAYWSGPGQPVLATLATAAHAHGFASNAFAPFLDSTRAGGEPIRPEDLDALGLGDVRDALLFGYDQGVRALTLIPDEPQLLAAVREAFPAARVVSPAGFNSGLGAAIQSDFTRFLTLASLAVIGLLAVLFRDPRRIATALVPVVTAVAAMAGGMGALGLGFNLFNIVAATLVIGLSVDYGIFLVCEDPTPSAATRRAVLVSGLTTLAGFGALALARHPALQSIGISVLLGVGAGLPAALWVIPALRRPGPPT